MDERSPIFGVDPERIDRLLAWPRSDDAEDPSAAPLEQFAEGPGAQIGRYRLVRVIGEGGMGVIFLAEQIEPVRREVALKILKPGMDSKRVISRFETEQQALALMEHLYIARVYDAGVAPSGRPYFVMEHVQGLPITEHCDQHSLTIEQRLNLFLHVCEAVQHAHQKGIIHRDLKPSNILVAIQDQQAIPKVIDFGVARAIAEPLTARTRSTEQGQFIGTPEYMSPEQADIGNQDIDTRTDIYSLGVVLYELLAGVLPFEFERVRDGGLDRLRQIIREQDPKTPSTRLADLGRKAPEVALNRRTDVRTLAKDLHRELEWIPVKAMRKERDQRYQTVTELAQDVRNYLDGIPLVAGPPSTLYRLKKFAKRNQTLMTTILVVGLTVVIGSGVSLTMYVRAKVQSERSRAVSSFLNDTVLRALDPYREQGGQITALSVLNAVATGLEDRFPDAPLMEAEVRHRLGRAYVGNGEYDAAVQHLQRAIEIRSRELGNRHPLTMESVHRLAWTFYSADRLSEAGLLFPDLVAEYSRRFGEEDPRTISVKRMLSWTYIGLGERDAAMRLGQESLDSARRALGDEHELTVTATGGMGALHFTQDDYDGAERWFGEALQLSRQAMGQDHVLTWDFTRWLGSVYILQGRYAEAERALMESFTQESRIFGERSWQAIWNMERLTHLYILWNKPEQVRTWRAKLTGTASGVSPEGSTRYDEAGDTYVIRGCGMDIWDISDEFHFAHKTLYGDGSITARIDAVENIHLKTKAGIMIRKTRETTSEYASAFITPSGAVTFQRRIIEGGVGSRRQAKAGHVAFPHWIRLNRRGNAFSAQHSSDGINWEEIIYGDPTQANPIEIPMDEAVCIGLAVTSRDVTKTAEARISHVTTTGDVRPSGPFTESQDIRFQLPASPNAGTDDK